MDTTSNRKQNFFSEWLEKLQQESWQLELLISGLALFGIWESKSTLYKIEYFIDVNSISEIAMIADLFTSLLWTSWFIFLFNLLIHIIIRGFWIGAIGLRYVSGDIDFDDLNYSDKFTAFFKKRIGSFDSYIERLEKISSVLFSFTFLLFFMLLSFVMFVVVWIILYSILNHFFPEQPGKAPVVIITFGFIYWLIGFLVMIDFFTLGAFKKINEKYISGFYFYIYRFYAIVSLSFIYRPLLLNFIDNRYTRRLFFLSIPYTLILIGVRTLDVSKFVFFPSYETKSSFHTEMVEESVNWRYYDDLREEYHRTFDPNREDLLKEKIKYISLANYECDQDYLKFFVEYIDEDNDFLELEGDKITPFRKKGLMHLFSRESVQDEGLEAIEKRELAEILLVTKVIRKKDLPADADPKLIEKFKDFTKDDIKEARNLVTEKYDELKSIYQVEKIKKIKRKLLTRFEFYIDGNQIDEKLDCRFYIHPNMREKGLLCYAPIDSLAYGGHMFDMHRKTKKRTRKRNIPFRKIKNK